MLLCEQWSIQIAESKEKWVSFIELKGYEVLYMEKFIVEHTICPSCGVGCGLNIICIDGVPKGIYPTKDIQ